jgi:hypothetical protein
VYGPNLDQGSDLFYGSLESHLERWENLPKIIGGDWNATYSNLSVEENPDVIFMRSLPSKVRSDFILDMCRNRSLSDPFRTLNPDAREFTYNPSGQLRKNRSRIDFFLITDDVYASVDRCTVAQGFCSKSFDHKPIFLQLKKKRGTGRATVSNRTIDHKLAMYVVKIAVYVTFLSACIPMAGLASGHLLLRDMETVSNIKTKINNIVFLEGMQLARDLTDPEQESLRNLEAEVDELWNTVTSLDELQEREKQVRDDVFFEQLIENTRKSLLTFQTLLNIASKSALKVWTNELVRLRKDDYEANFERI